MNCQPFLCKLLALDGDRTHAVDCNWLVYRKRQQGCLIHAKSYFFNSWNGTWAHTVAWCVKMRMLIFCLDSFVEDVTREWKHSIFIGACGPLCLCLCKCGFLQMNSPTKTFEFCKVPFLNWTIPCYYSGTQNDIANHHRGISHPF